MRRDPDSRDRLIEASMRYAENEMAIRDLTRRMHGSSCEGSPPCWARDDGEAWKDPQADIPDDYCEACQRSTVLARERHVLKGKRWARRETLLRAAAIYSGTINGACCAGPAAGSGGLNRANNGDATCINHPSSFVGSLP